MSNSKKFTTCINSTTETAFQRAIFLNNKTKLGSKTAIEWLDMELPIDAARNCGRGHCPDLIGRIGNRYVLCELKFGKGSTDSPEDAANELKRYYDAIKINHMKLDADKLRHENGKPFLWKDLAKKDTMLVIAANAAYWVYWLGHREVSIPKGVYCYSVDVPVNYFKLQKGSAEGVNYTPFMETDKWDIIATPKK